MLNSPKALVVTETWLKADSFLANVLNYSFVSSYRVSGSRRSLGMYLHDIVYYQVINKSCNYTNNIDYILIALSQFNVAICYMYCLPQTK